MSTAAPLYRRLPGRAIRHFGLFSRQRQRLWLAEDHVLLISTRTYREEHRRFFFEDIQALTICGTNAGKGANFLLAAALMLSGFTGMVSWYAGGVAVPILAGLAWAVLAPLLAANVAFGPTCACYLQTAVQRERIYALGRLRTAVHVVDDLLAPRIEAVQGAVQAEEAEPPVS